jgi:hypothetical protein
MRKHIILFFSALLFLFACKGSKKINGVIGEDVMIRLLADIHLVDGSLYNQAGADSLYKYGTDRYRYVFKKFHTDSAQFKKSMKYYTTQTDELLKMYDEVAKILQHKTDSLSKIRTQEAKKQREREAKLRKEAEKLQKDTTRKNALPK